MEKQNEQVVRTLRVTRGEFRTIASLLEYLKIKRPGGNQLVKIQEGLEAVLIAGRGQHTEVEQVETVDWRIQGSPCVLIHSPAIWGGYVVIANETDNDVKFTFVNGFFVVDEVNMQPNGDGRYFVTIRKGETVKLRVMYPPDPKKLEYWLSCEERGGGSPAPVDSEPPGGGP